jgi:hypothetical protein
MVTQARYSVAGRSKSRVMLCAVCTVHEDTRSMRFLVEPQNQGRWFVYGLFSKPLGWFVCGLASKLQRRFVSCLTSKPLGRFFGLGLKTKRVAVCRLHHKNDRRM